MNREEIDEAVKNPDTRYVWTLSFEPLSSDQVDALSELLERNNYTPSFDQLSILTPGHRYHDHWDL